MSLTQLLAPDGGSSPWVDHRWGQVDALHAQLAAQPHRRFLKTHLALDGLPIYRQLDNILLVHYANMLADPVAEIGRMADFLTIDVSDEVLAEIVKKNSLKAMRQRASVAEAKENKPRRYRDGPASRPVRLPRCNRDPQWHFREDDCQLAQPA